MTDHVDPGDRAPEAVPGPGAPRTRPSSAPVSDRGAGFWLSAAMGWLVIFWGARYLLHHHVDTRPPNAARFFIGGAVINDLLFVPVVLVLGVGLARVVPGRWRAYVQSGVFIAGCLVLFTYPELRDYARILHNPTSLPYNYTEHLVAVILGVWAVIAVIAVVSVIRTSRRRAEVAGVVEPPDQPAVPGHHDL